MVFNLYISNYTYSNVHSTKRFCRAYVLTLTWLIIRFTNRSHISIVKMDLTRFRTFRSSIFFFNFCLTLVAFFLSCFRCSCVAFLWSVKPFIIFLYFDAQWIIINGDYDKDVHYKVLDLSSLHTLTHQTIHCTVYNVQCTYSVSFDIVCNGFSDRFNLIRCS